MSRISSRTESMSVVVTTTLIAALLALVAVPEEVEAAPKVKQRGDIVISENGAFDKEHGVRRGNGTRSNPYVISNWDVSNIILRDTSRYVVIKNNVIRNQLVLNWNGDRVDIHHNEVGDLRVNQNVPRTGDATDGKIHHNTFGLVGQLRHWDGVFERNKIGSPTLLAKRGSYKAMQVDGFHGSKLRNNTIFGYVDVKLHGHHHGSGFTRGSHYHGGEDGYEGSGPHRHSVDHSRRYHQVQISNNKIYSDHAWALRYYDQAHAGDDRTNASETNKFLNCPHVHFTRVAIEKNVLQGGGVVVDVFNAFDENHWGTKRGSVKIRGNRVTLDRDVEDLVYSRSGITVRQAVDIDLHIAGNYVDGVDMVEENDVLGLESRLNKGAGINLLGLDEARVHIHDNRVTHREFGILAANFSKSVRWWVDGLKTYDVSKPVQYDDSVKNPPNKS